MHVLDTERLNLRWLVPDDAPFILQLTNEPSWIQHIGDKGIRTVDDARAYIAAGPQAMYAKRGFGLYLVALKDSGTPIGLCGLIKRDTLDDVDIGYALLPAFWGDAYAYESATAVLALARNHFGLSRVVAITSPDNERSGRLLRRLGMQFERRFQPSPDQAEINLFGLALQD